MNRCGAKNNIFLEDMHKNGIITQEEKELFLVSKKGWSSDSNETKLFFSLIEKLIEFQRGNKALCLGNISYPDINFSHFDIFEESTIDISGSKFYGEFKLENIKITNTNLTAVAIHAFNVFNFNNIVFGGTVNLSGSTFEKKVLFQECTHNKDFYQYDCTFLSDVFYENINIRGEEIGFIDSKIQGDFYLYDSIFYCDEIDFSGVEFDKKCFLKNVDFLGKTDFSSTIFYDALLSENVKGLETADWEFSRCIINCTN